MALPKGTKRPPRSKEWCKKLSEASKGRNVWNKGKHLSKETKKKLSDAHKGKKHKNSKDTRKKISIALTGKKLPSKTKKKISDSLKGNIPWNKGLRGYKTGKNHWNWQGGITPELTKIRNSLDFIIWRERVFKRNNWTCQKCFKRGVELNAHHIQNFAQYPELRFEISNGITLCKKCHKEFHYIYNRKNNTKKQLEFFIRNNASI